MKEMGPDRFSVVLVDDEEEVLFSSSLLLESHGITPVLTMNDGRKLLPHLDQHGAGAVILDLFMPHVSGVELLPEIVARHPATPVVVMTASQEVETAVACMREGAFDYLVKPVEESRYVSCVRRALETSSLRQQVGALKRSLLHERLEHDQAFSEIITNSARMFSLFQYLEAIADSREAVLITGETGVGKGLIAQAMHRISKRNGEMVSVNVAGLDDNMFSDTLFGHRKGAYSGATEHRDGMVAKAAGGTLFLDEIGDLKKTSQVKLLRLLQEQTYYPLGSDVARMSDARIVAATNQDLRQALSEGRFRPDLYYRLSGHQVEVPPLRERTEDLPLLLGHFLEDAAGTMAMPTPEPTPELLTLLSLHDFPGNVRELRAMIFDAVARHRSGPFLSMESFKEAMERGRTRVVDAGQQNVSSGIQPAVHVSGPFPTLKELEALIIAEALRRAGSNQGIAAMLLGISRPALNRRLARMKVKAAE
ncbi:MAG: sigma-54 dependent transcriptional regulator [Gammaproteobacteria bacterium]|nr:sigma-54 dependent transcriptional regulator [Gammaproteobacteria bacterium]